MKRILITGAGGSPAANFIRSLRSSREKYFIVGTDVDEYYLKRSEADASYLVPHRNDPKYVDFLNYIIKEHAIEFIHAQNDFEIEVLSKNREQLQARLFLPSKKTISICLDKYKTYKIWKQNKIKVPETYTINSENDLKEVYEKLNSYVWLREITGAGGKGSLAPKNFDQAKAWIDFKEGWGKFVASQFLSPDSVTWMSIWKNGELIVAQGRKRLYWELAKISPSGITGVTGAGMTINDPLIDKIAIESIKNIDSNPQGIFSVDLTYDSSGFPNPTEINIGRFFTTSEFFTQAGLNMPEIYIKVAYNEKLPKFPRILNPLKNGLIWIRGVDFLPILTTESEIEKERKAMEDTLKKLI